MAAFAFNNSIELLATKNNQTLADFTYDNYEMRQVFVKQLSTLDFRGVSVRINSLVALHICIYINL